jgi:hypothetical protein
MHKHSADQDGDHAVVTFWNVTLCETTGTVLDAGCGHSTPAVLFVFAFLLAVP